MAKSILTAARLRELLSYDPETGVFTWLVNRGPNQTAGKPAGSPDEEGYLRIGIDRRRYRAHRLAWFYVYGVWPELELDHWDTDQTNNRIGNLREATRAMNQENIRRCPAKKSSLPMGVVKLANEKKFRAQISVQGKKMALGHFPTADAAHDAYITAKRQFHEGCTL